MSAAVSPRSVLLNFVRTARGAVTVRQLIELGRLFGFNANATRVAVARLVADLLLESDERGSYRLAPAARVVNEHVESWRRGESRMKPWRGEWIVAALPSKVARPQRRSSLRALARLGLREGLPNMWVRPDNLKHTFDETAERLRSLGLEDGAELFRARDFSQPLVRRFSSELWPLQALLKGYEGSLHDLSRSIERLEVMPLDTALVQSFLLGGEAIRVLATDPLLPEQILPSAARAELTKLMLRYDAVGRDVWRNFARKGELSLLKGGAGAG